MVWGSGDNDVVCNCAELRLCELSRRNVGFTVVFWMVCVVLTGRDYGRGWIAGHLESVFDIVRRTTCLFDVIYTGDLTRWNTAGDDDRYVNPRLDILPRIYARFSVRVKKLGNRHIC